MAEATVNGQTIYLVTTGVDASGGVVSSKNSSTATLGAGATFTGVAEECTKYNQLSVLVYSDQAGTVYLDQSSNGDNWDETQSWAIAAGVTEAHAVLVVAKYFRVRYGNGGVVQGTFRLQAMMHESAAAISAPTDPVGVVIKGKQIDGEYAEIGATVESFLKAYVAGPAGAYGDILVAQNVPVVQSDFAAGVLFADQWVQLLVGSGGISFDGSLVNVETGTTVNSYAFLSSRRLVRERGGQGRLARFSALFTSPAANSMQIAGLFTAANGFAFGYYGAAFGVHHLYNGVYEIRKVTVTTASTTAENATVKLNGVNYSVAVTNSGDKTTTANELAAGSYGGVWSAYSMSPAATDPYVVFVAVAPGAKSGAYSLTATSAVGTFAQVKAGASPSYNFIAQSSWNNDPMDGTGPSAMTLVPTYGNVYAIDHQFLGFGAVCFYVEEPTTGRLVLVHRLRYANANSIPNVANASMPLGMLAQSFGSTTNLAVKCGAVSGFLQGPEVMLGSRRSVSKATSGLGASYAPLLSIRNPLVYASKVSFAEVRLQLLSLAADGNKPVDFALVLNPTLTGPVWRDVDTTKSVLQTDTTASAYTAGIENFATSLGKTGSSVLDLSTLGLYLRPGDVVTIVARSAAASDTNVSLVVIEDV